MYQISYTREYIRSGTHIHTHTFYALHMIYTNLVNIAVRARTDLLDQLVLILRIASRNVRAELHVGRIHATTDATAAAAMRHVCAQSAVCSVC